MTVYLHPQYTKKAEKTNVSLICSVHLTVLKKNMKSSKASVPFVRTHLEETIKNITPTLKTVYEHIFKKNPEGGGLGRLAESDTPIKISVGNFCSDHLFSEKQKCQKFRIRTSGYDN